MKSIESFKLIFWWIINLISNRILLISEPDKRHIVNSFEDPHGVTEDEGPQFNNIVVDKNTGRVYIGAVNKLYQLSPNLEPTVSIIFWSSRVALSSYTAISWYTYKGQNYLLLIAPYGPPLCTFRQSINMCLKYLVLHPFKLNVWHGLVVYHPIHTLSSITLKHSHIKLKCLVYLDINRNSFSYQNKSKTTMVPLTMLKAGYCLV